MPANNSGNRHRRRLAAIDAEGVVNSIGFAMVSIPSRASGLRIAVDSMPAQRRSEPAAALLCPAVELPLRPYRSGATLDRHYPPNGMRPVARTGSD